MSLHDIVIGFDFGLRRIGMAVGNAVTQQATPLPTILAHKGVIQDWRPLDACINNWKPTALIVGLPTHINGQEQYTTKAARLFAKALAHHFHLPIGMVDERLSTVEARALLFEAGGCKKIRKTEVDSIAACVILEQWLRHPTDLHATFTEY